MLKLCAILYPGYVSGGGKLLYKQCRTEQSAARQRVLLEGLLDAMNQQHYDEITVSSLCTQMGCRWWDKAVARYGDETVEFMWAEAKASHHISKLQSALNLAKSTEIHSARDNFDIATRLMKQAEPHLKKLKGFKEKYPVLLSRYTTIADAVCEEILEREVRYYNLSTWESTLKKRALTLLRFCYRYAATIRFQERCKLNINITLGRKEDAPLFPNGYPDNLVLQSERAKRNAILCGILTGLEERE